LIDLLVADGLVSPAPNPRHKRSFVYAITDLGLSRLRDTDAREDPLFDQLEAALGLEGLTAALELFGRLRALSASFEGQLLAEGGPVADRKDQKVPNDGQTRS
jgi:DNA-binding MarR family transcriptional regulator